MQALLSTFSSRHEGQSPDSQARAEAAVASGGNGSPRLSSESDLVRRFEAARGGAEVEQLARGVEAAETPEDLLAVFEDLEDGAMGPALRRSEDGTTLVQTLRQLVQQRAGHPDQPQAVQQQRGATEEAVAAAFAAASPPEVAQLREVSRDTVFLRIKEKAFLAKDDERNGLTIAVRLHHPKFFVAG